MKNRLIVSLLALLLVSCAADKKVSKNVSDQGSDQFLWLEDVGGEKQLDWVRQRNEKSIDYISASPLFEKLLKTNEEIYNRKDRIPYISQRGGYLYNFWRDDKHIRGIYRRTTHAEYRKKDPKWETVLDVDLLAKEENENWVYKGMNCRYPDYDLCLVSLSRGGADAVVMREFDLNKKQFVEGGFYIPEGRSGVSWIDQNSLLISSNFGEGSLTDSGYPRVVKIWERNTPLADSRTVYEGEVSDVGVWPSVQYDGDKQYLMAVRSVTFYTQKNVLIEQSGQTTELDIPDDASLLGLHKDQMIFELKSDWQAANKKYSQGDVLSINIDDFLKGARDFDTVVESTRRSSFSGLTGSKDYIYITMLEDVISQLYQLQWNGQAWEKTRIQLPGMGTASISSTSAENNIAYLSYNSFLEPSTLYEYHAESGQRQAVKQLPALFDSSRYAVKQNFAKAADGEKIPYFIVHAKGMRYDGNNPTLLYGYGGFEISLRPSYSSTIGTNWLDNGGVYVLANIRGGGEYGPGWHQAALKEKRHVAFNDFITVAEDLIDRKITSPEHLGIRGGSNGGLLVGTVFTMRPDLFNAVVCSVPLLDMKRFNKLLVGASWMAEYGNPDKPEEWAYIKKYSPYHNVFSDKKYPRVFFTTSTRDDRVHPAHARKMVAKMESQGHDVLYYENIEGGHGGSANNNQAAYLNALVYSYLLKQLK